KPKDPNDPTKGYEPPTPKDPNDPTQDTPVPYVPAGTVTVHYEDENGNVIKDPTVDTPKSPVGTEYNTNENGEEIPKEIIGKDGKVYVLVKVKDGDEETGKVGKGNKDVTYIYKVKEDPEKPTPEEPGKPGTEEPGKPGTEEPGKPGTEEPGKPGTEEPGKPGTEEPGKPGTEEPGKPGTEEPGKPGTEEPGKPGTEEPGKPGTEEPGKPGQPEKPAMDQPSKDMDDKGMKQADKAMDKELPETGNTNNPFVTAFGFLALLAGVRLTKRNRRED
ncbi:MucBP domain-containing protein, partial [Staphylococcus microti]